MKGETRALRRRREAEPSIDHKPPVVLLSRRSKNPSLRQTPQPPVKHTSKDSARRPGRGLPRLQTGLRDGRVASRLCGFGDTSEVNKN